MTAQEVIQKIEHADYHNIKFAVTDIDGVLRGKVISKGKFLKAVKENIGFCNVIFGWDMNDAVYDNTTISGWETGYHDAFATLDLSTLRHIPWNDNQPFFLADFSNDSTLSGACPRTLLKKIRQQSIDMGFTPLFSKEFEWFNFKETPQSLQDKSFVNPTPITPGMFGYSILRPSENQGFFNDLFNLLHQFKVPL